MHTANENGNKGLQIVLIYTFRYRKAKAMLPEKHNIFNLCIHLVTFIVDM